MNNIQEAFIQDLRKIIDKNCFQIGFSLESIILLDFGRVLIDAKPRTHPKTKDYLTHGEYSLRVVTAWRIEKNNKIFCTWNYYDGYYDNEGNYHDNRAKTLTVLEDNLIKILENKKVVDVFIDENTKDFYIDFEENIRFRVFCEMNQWDWNDETSEMYIFTTKNDLYSIETNDTIIHEDLKGEFIYYEDFLKSN
ncbi:MAG: hypothetical protein RO257_01495 [Candidatus Kapabacteria bacterium]|jgi:hypothetical protein|nr:hypothetical protein [Candidatus Kapabacteria bacterium]